jgi:chondroitin AC lyase
MRLLLVILSIIQTAAFYVEPAVSSENLSDEALSNKTLLDETVSDETMSEEISLIAQRLRDRFLNSVPQDLEARTRTLLEGQAADGSWPDVDYDDQSNTHWKPSRHLSHLETLARAYRIAEGVYTGDAGVKEACRLGLGYWVERNPISKNWWFNVISSPRQLSAVLLLMADEFPPELVAAAAVLVHKSGFTRTGANLVDEAGNLLVLACATGDEGLLRRAVDHISGEVRVTADEGIQVDDSFHQHGPQNMVISYGSVFARDQAGYAELFAGTSFAYSTEQIRVLSRFVLDGQQWFIRGRQIDYHAMGRGAFRGGKGSHVWNARSFSTIARRLEAADADRADEYQAWARRVEGKEAAGWSGPLGNKHFWRSDAMVQREKKWYASVRFHSTRVYATETRTNRENLKGYHLADGVYFLLQRGDEYHQVQPVWNYRRLPGLTFLDTNAPIPYGSETPKAGNTVFVGGVSDGRFGAAVMDYDKGGVSAKKAYFFTPDGLVCLGAGISSAQAEPVLTSLNQCRLYTDITLLEKGKLVALQPEEVERDGIRAVHHDGVAYVLLDGQKVGVSARQQQGSWREVEAKASDEPVPQDIFTCWIDHGVGPNNAAYAYRIVPGVEAKDLPGLVNESSVRILANTPKLQAVYFEARQLTQAVFHAGGSLELPGGGVITADRACTLIWRRIGAEILLSVSDPAQHHRQLILHLQGRYIGRGAADLPVGTRVVVDLPQGEYAGQTVIIPLSSI